MTPVKILKSEKLVIRGGLAQSDKAWPWINDVAHAARSHISVLDYSSHDCTRQGQSESSTRLLPHIIVYQNRWDRGAILVGDKSSELPRRRRQSKDKEHTSTYFLLEEHFASLCFICQSQVSLSLLELCFLLRSQKKGVKSIANVYSQCLHLKRGLVCVLSSAVKAFCFVQVTTGNEHLIFLPNKSGHLSSLLLGHLLPLDHFRQ